jgi:16S rRNA (guanine966-N2)-methyltransferase
MLTIIGGDAGGRILRAPDGIRPILARIKKSVFDILRPRLDGCVFLDLFAGSGSVGLEALSRGARFSVFVEHDRRCTRVLGANIASLGYQQRCSVIVADVLRDLFWIERARETLNRCGGVPAFDVVFAGPPYVDRMRRPLSLSTPTLRLIANAGIVASGGVAVVQHSVREQVATEGFCRIRREEYGDTAVDFLVVAADGAARPAGADGDDSHAHC